MDTSLSRRMFIATPAFGLAWPKSPRAGSNMPVQETRSVPTYRGNLARTGENPGPGPAGQPKPRWQLRLGTTITSSPAVVDNVVYVGSISAGTMEGGALHAIDAQTGVERWRLLAEQGDGIFSSPAVGAGIVAVGTYDGVVLAADTELGNERWRFRAQSALQLQSPAILDGIVYLTDSGGHLYALNADDGEERWRFTSGDGVERSFSSPAIAEGVVYCVDASRRPGDPSFLRAFDAASGKERWAFTPDDGIGISGTPVIVGNQAYLFTRGNHLLAVDTSTGEEQVRHNLGVEIGTPLATADGLAYFGTQIGELHAIDVHSGEPRWSRQLSDGLALVSPPTVADGVVYVGDVDGAMYALDAFTGRERWRSRVRMLRSSPAIIDGMLYVGARNGSLRAASGLETGAWPLD